MSRPLQKLQQNLSYGIRVEGARRAELGDLYHWLLRLRWWKLIGLVIGLYLFLNAAFGALFVATGGVAGAQPGSYVDAFFFSVQTFGTIGYGDLHPVTHLANAVVVVESIVSLLTTALVTGLVFVRFSLSRARMVFGDQVAVGPMDGVPTLMIRLGNDRSSQLFDAQMRANLMITTTTAEGVKFYRSQELALVRDRAPALSRSWTILHRIDEKSPLYGVGPDDLKKQEAELTISVSGVDDVSMQAVHARWIYEASSIVFGARLADILREEPDGNMVLDLSKFHALTPTPKTDSFPFSAAS